MAAVSELPAPELIELRQLRSEDMEPVLAEETCAWRERLHWDFSPSADLVRRFVGVQALNGYALATGGHIAGYAYYVYEEHKGLVGDLYVMEAFRNIVNEHRLLEAVIEALFQERGIRRIESQLMMLDSAFERLLPGAPHLRVHVRNFMAIDLQHAAKLPRGAAADAVRFDTWMPYRQEEAARLIAEAYRGHVDSDINDQYRSLPGARRFLMNIVQYPGCGSFFQPASFLAMNTDVPTLYGISLASLVSTHTGHITQICVSPAAQRRGVGFEMLRRSLDALRQHGCREATLTVTASNRQAALLYERMGFRVVRHFPACVWEGF